jgi:acyl-CoA reductase-like NAD-dependent aldehyde dehydrogenase
VANECFPSGLIALAQGAGEVGGWLTQSVDAICFTGSVASGKKVAALAAERLIPASLELGGKDAAIVLADCDLNRTVLGVAHWALHNAGQNCAAIERVYVEEAIAASFVDKLTALVSNLRTPTPNGLSDLGPLQNLHQLEVVETQVAQAIASGAQLRCGGKRTGVGLGFLPTVLDHCTAAMNVVRDETFGPVIAVVRVANAEEGLRQANDCRYGLNGSVWTKNLERGAQLAKQLDVGVAYVNNHSLGGILADVPWTGTKESGTGVAASRFSYAHFVRPRTLLIDASRQADPWWMPVDENTQTFAQALIAQTLHGGLRNLLRLAGVAKKRTQALKRASQ